MIKPKKPRAKKCKGCLVKFQPDRQMQEACSVKCAIAVANAKRMKKENAEHRERKRSIKPISHWLKATQTKFNRWVVLRDKTEPCISCGAWDVEEFHAGHWRSRGAASQLRFAEDNCHKQCSECNTHKSGNQIEYRQNLIIKIGVERVEALENDNKAKSWTYEELKEIREHYAALSKVLE